MMSVSKEGIEFRQKTLNMEEGGREAARTGRRNGRRDGRECNGSWLRQELHKWHVGCRVGSSGGVTW